MLELSASGLQIRRPLRRARRLYYEDIESVEAQEGGARLTLHQGRALKVKAAPEVVVALQAILTPALGPLEHIDDLRARIQARLALPGFSARPFVEELLHGGVALNASDLHLQPNLHGGHGLSIRVDGALSQLTSTSPDQASRIIGRLKAMARAQVHRADQPQEGRVELAGGWARLSFTPSIAGEAVTARLFDRLKGEAELDGLGFEPGLTRRLDGLLRQPRGLLLFSGPSGSGKTTTLYTALRRRVAEGHIRALTVEDPVEYRLDGVVQLEARGATSGPDLLRAALRHDADLLVVGEAREADSVSLMLKAALTGHLVLATVHAGGPAEALSRLLSLGAPPELLSEVLLGALNQRLLRLRCCESGCARCDGAGYRGRRAVGALLEADDGLKATLRRGELLSDGPDLLNAARTLVSEGRTDAAELARVFGPSAVEESWRI